MLREKVESLLESTIRQTVIDVAKETYTRLYGTPLLEAIGDRSSYRRSDYHHALHNAVIAEVKATAERIVVEDEEVQAAIKRDVLDALKKAFRVEEKSND